MRIGGKLVEKGKLDYNNGDELAVKVIYGEFFNLPVRFLHAEMEETSDIPKLADSIELVKAYNNFQGKDVADSLRKLHGEGLVMNAIFGREYSPVLYVRPPYWTGQKANYDGSSETRKFTKEEREEMFEEITEELRKTNPDELGFTAGTEPCELSEAYFVRAWWD